MIAGANPAVLVDRAAGVIRGCSVVTGGVLAKGHDLWTDQVTLEQIAACGQKLGRVLVKLDHRSGGQPTGVDAVLGWLQDFRIEGEHTRADLHLYPSHPKRDLYLDIAEKTPELMGLSAAFVPTAEPAVVDGRKCARVEELVTVDIVCQPAANPGGWFEAMRRPEAIDAVESLDNFAMRRLRELAAKIRRGRDEDIRGERTVRVAISGAGGLVGAIAGLRSARGREIAGAAVKAGDVVERNVFGGMASHRGVVLPSGRVVHVKRSGGESPFVGTASVGTDRLANFRPSRVHRPDVSAPVRNPHTQSRSMHYNPISANSDQKLRAATGARFPDQVRRAVAGATVGAAAGYVAARAAQARRRETEGRQRSFSADVDDLTKRLQDAREKAARRQRIKAALTASAIGAGVGSVTSRNALVGARTGAAVGGAVGAVWPKLFERRLDRRTELALGLPGPAAAGGALARVAAAISGLKPWQKYGLVAAGGALAGAALRPYANGDERERPGLVRRAATGAIGAYAGAKLGGSLLRRFAPAGSILRRNAGVAGGVAGGLAGFLLEAKARRVAVDLEAGESEFGGLPDDVVDQLESIVRENVMPRTAQYASHSLASLSRRIPLQPDQILALIESGELKAVDGRNINDDLAVFDQGNIEAIRAALIEAEIEQAVHAHRNDPAVQRDPRALVPIVRVAIQAFLKPKST